MHRQTELVCYKILVLSSLKTCILQVNFLSISVEDNTRSDIWKRKIVNTQIDTMLIFVIVWPKNYTSTQKKNHKKNTKNPQKWTLVKILQIQIFFCFYQLPIIFNQMDEKGMQHFCISILHGLYFHVAFSSMCLSNTAKSHKRRIKVDNT